MPAPLSSIVPRVWSRILTFPLMTMLSAPGALLASEIVEIPYAVVDNGWWSGLAITNTSPSAISPIVYLTTSDGENYCTGIGSIAPGEIFAERVENIFTGVELSSRVSLQVASNNAVAFGATLFIGQSSGGFGFQEFMSETSGVTWACIDGLTLGGDLDALSD